MDCQQKRTQFIGMKESLYKQADRACGSSAHGQTDSQLNILLLLCSYICSTYYVRYVEYKYRSARKLDLMDTSNPPQADIYVDIQFCF